MKARIKFRKNGVMKYIGHLDLMRYFQKVMRRAQIPIAFSGGFSPHMIMSFAQPLGVGLTSDAEYMDIELTERITTATAITQLNDEMVEGIEIINFLQIPEDKKSAGMSIVAAADYLATPTKGALPTDMTAKVQEFLRRREIIVLKETKRSEAKVDIRPLIHDLQVRDGAVFLCIAAGSAQNLKPDLVMQALSENMTFHYHRLEVYALQNEWFVPLEELGTVIV